MLCPQEQIPKNHHNCLVCIFFQDQKYIKQGGCLLPAYFDLIIMKFHQFHLIFIQSFKLDCKLPTYLTFFKTSAYFFKLAHTFAQTHWTFYSTTSFLEKCRKVVLEKWFFKLRIFFSGQPLFSNLKKCGFIV